MGCMWVSAMKLGFRGSNKGGSLICHGNGAIRTRCEYMKDALNKARRGEKVHIGYAWNEA